NSEQGTHYSYDVLGRVTRVEHADGASREIAYELAEDGTNLAIRNERGAFTRMLYGAYGDPDSGMLLRIDSPEGVQTNIRRDVLGQVISVWKGQNGGQGYVRSYEYDNRKFLVSRTDPEIGVTTFGRDEIGNM